ncbi:hypothetical protein MBANPS3_006883 [Mucor bainieri]
MKLPSHLFLSKDAEGVKRKAIDDIHPSSKHVKQLIDSIENDEDIGIDDAPAFFRLQKRIKVASPAHEWVVNGRQVSSQITKYQKSCIEIVNHSGFVLETHVHEVLMLSSILLVKPNQHSNALLSHLPAEELDMIRNQVLSSACQQEAFSSIEFDDALMMKILKIVKDLAKGKITRKGSDKKLNDLKDTSSGDELRILQAIFNMVQKLPFTPIAEPLGELELTTSYLDLLLFPLLTDFDQNTKLVWPNLLQKEARISSANVNQSKRPDAVIRYIHQHNYAEVRGFGEVKTKERIDEHYDLVRDLAVGSRLTFYLFTLAHDGIYVVVEICSVDVPNFGPQKPILQTKHRITANAISICRPERGKENTLLSLEDLPSFMTQLDDVMLVLSIYQTSCIKSATPLDATHERPTLESPAFHDYIDKHKSKFSKPTVLFS